MKTFLIALALSLTTSMAFSSEGVIRERGTDSKLTFRLENRTAIFFLEENGRREEIRRIPVRDVGGAELSPEALGLEKLPKSKAITEGYGDLTDWLVQNLDMGIVFMPYISGPAYVGYSLSYLYALPADLLGKEHRARRKYLQLTQGKDVKVSRRVFTLLVDRISGK